MPLLNIVYFDVEQIILFCWEKNLAFFRVETAKDSAGSQIFGRPDR